VENLKPLQAYVRHVHGFLFIRVGILNNDFPYSKPFNIQFKKHGRVKK